MRRTLQPPVLDERGGDERSWRTSCMRMMTPRRRMAHRTRSLLRVGNGSPLPAALACSLQLQIPIGAIDLQGLATRHHLIAVVRYQGSGVRRRPWPATLGLLCSSLMSFMLSHLLAIAAGSVGAWLWVQLALIPTITGDGVVQPQLQTLKDVTFNQDKRPSISKVCVAAGRVGSAQSRRIHLAHHYR